MISNYKHLVGFIWLNSKPYGVFFFCLSIKRGVFTFSKYHHNWSGLDCITFHSFFNLNVKYYIPFAATSSVKQDLTLLWSDCISRSWSIYGVNAITHVTTSHVTRLFPLPTELIKLIKNWTLSLCFLSIWESW